LNKQKQFWQKSNFLSRLLLISTVFLGSTVALVLTSFEHPNQTTPPDDIIGNYYRFSDASAIFSDANDTREYNLSIESGFKYNETIKVTGSSPNKCKIQGKWTISGDTVVFIPTKRKWRKRVPERPNFNHKNGVISNADTLVYKDNALWKFNRSTKRLAYKQYSKKVTM
jgi:hypothetical protein